MANRLGKKWKKSMGMKKKWRKGVYLKLKVRAVAFKYWCINKTVKKLQGYIYIHIKSNRLAMLLTIQEFYPKCYTILINNSTFLLNNYI